MITFKSAEKDRVVSIREDVQDQIAFLEAKDGAQPRIVVLKAEDAEFIVTKLHEICCEEDQALSRIIARIAGSNSEPITIDAKEGKKAS